MRQRQDKLAAMLADIPIRSAPTFHADPARLTLPIHADNPCLTAPNPSDNPCLTDPRRHTDPARLTAPGRSDRPRRPHPTFRPGPGLSAALWRFVRTRAVRSVERRRPWWLLGLVEIVTYPMPRWRSCEVLFVPGMRALAGFPSRPAMFIPVAA